MKDFLLTTFELPACVTAEYYDSVDMFTRESIWQLCYRDLSKQDVKIASEEELSELCFNTDTIFPERLRGMAERVLQDGKTNHLNTCGLTGKGVKVAVIDRAICRDHVEFDGRLEYIKVAPDHPEIDHLDFHGMACAGFLNGATCGVAPESELVYFAIPNATLDREVYFGYQLEALKMIIEYNQTHASRIRVVSLSAGYEKSQWERRNELEKQLAETGCTLIDAVNFPRNFRGIDQVTNHGKTSFMLNKFQIEDYERNKHREGFPEYFASLCFVPSGRRTSPGTETNTEYIHWSKAVSESWTIPQVAGAYACCLQADPTLQFEEFIKRSKKCRKQDGHTILDVKTILGLA